MTQGGGSANERNSANPEPQEEYISSRTLDELLENVRESYSKYQKSGWKGARNDQSPKTKGGKEFKNKPPKLPQYDKQGNKIHYREFDVNSKLKGQPRDKERFVRGSDGKTYYSDNHYETFFKII